MDNYRFIKYYNDKNTGGTPSKSSTTNNGHNISNNKQCVLSIFNILVQSLVQHFNLIDHRSNVHSSLMIYGEKGDGMGGQYFKTDCAPIIKL